MAWLNAETGLLHFISVREEFYYTDSLCRLNLWQNLEWILREKGYDRVLRIRGKKGQWQIRRENTVFYGNTAEPFQKFLKEHGEQLLCDQREKTVFLIRSDLFLSFFEREMAQWCEKMEGNVKREGIFLVAIPKEKEEIFWSSERWLSYRLIANFLKDTKQKEGGEEKGTCLKEELGDRLCFFSDVTKKEIQNMIMRNKVIEGWKTDRKETEEMADFLFIYLHCATFRQHFDNLLPKNSKMPLAMMEKVLLKEEAREKLIQILKEQKEKVAEEKKKWISEERKKKKMGEYALEDNEIIQREGINMAEQTVEVPLYHMMVIQYEDGQKKNFFYPGRYKISDAEKVRRILLLRRKEKSFCVKWEMAERTDDGELKFKGSCHAKILSYSKGIAAYLFQEEARRRNGTFLELAGEKAFFQESLKRKIAFCLRETQRRGEKPERKKIEKMMNEKWMYENGICFFEFLVEEMEKGEGEKDGNKAI
ncbi:MAG: hypothetical protein Q4B90_06960 [Eubacteriales bacterium]|nr:hypothetical protein [Eubacteriales bacterium]